MPGILYRALEIFPLGHLTDKPEGRGGPNPRGVGARLSINAPAFPLRELALNDFSMSLFALALL
jgi:hypothetical protein